MIIGSAFVIHVFIPQLGWLNEQQQDRIFAGYASVAKAGFPIALTLASISLKRVLYPPKRDTESDD